MIIQLVKSGEFYNFTYTQNFLFYRILLFLFSLFDFLSRNSA